ncbi:MAG: peptidylprolyl isomerase [Bacteroidetes bacterium]|nr:peptidylprolyl isomerase [Bacteroidota bacterium]
MTVDGDKYSDTINVDIAWRTVKLESSLGDMQLWLHLKTPLHRDAFLNLIEEGYFDNHTFNRVINHFVIQGGCPDLPGGFTDTSLFIEPEFHDDLKHVFGAVGGGRDDNPGKKTNACQFYIVDDPKGPYNLSKLDGDYTIFGQVIKGLSVVDLISRVNTDKDDAPIEEVIFALSIETYTAQEIQKLFGYNISE